jgi:hypothetical protein
MRVINIMTKTTRFARGDGVGKLLPVLVTPRPTVWWREAWVALSFREVTGLLFHCSISLTTR